MTRSLLGGLLGLALVAYGSTIVQGHEEKKIVKKTIEGEIREIDHKKQTMTVMVHEGNKVVERVFPLGMTGVKFLDGASKPVGFDHFKVGHSVHLTEYEGKIIEVEHHVEKKEIRK